MKKTKEPAKRKLNKKIIASVIILIIAIPVLLIYQQSFQQPAKDYGTIEEKIARQLQEAQQKSKRPDYLPAEVYKNLPAFPGDFYKIDVLFMAGRMTDYVNLEEKYWKQPEFYPTFEMNLEKIRNPQLNWLYAFGYGAYPGDVVTEASAGDDFTVATFFYTSWLVETWQGMKMMHFYPADTGVPTQDLSGTWFTVTQDPDKVKDYFEVSINPSIVLLEPSSPIFGYNWTQKILVHVKIKDDAPKGRYVIGVNPVTPPKEYSNQWIKQYLLKYADASSGLAGRPYFRIVVDIK